MTDNTRPYTQRDVAAQEKRTRQIADAKRIERDIDARLNRRSFSEPGLSVDAMLELFEPGALAQEREDKRRNDEIEDAIAEPTDPDFDRIMGIESEDLE